MLIFMTSVNIYVTIKIKNGAHVIIECKTKRNYERDNRHKAALHCQFQNANIIIIIIRVIFRFCYCNQLIMFVTVKALENQLNSTHINATGAGK